MHRTGRVNYAESYIQSAEPIIKKIRKAFDDFKNKQQKCMK